MLNPNLPSCYCTGNQYQHHNHCGDNPVSAPLDIDGNASAQILRKGGGNILRRAEPAAKLLLGCVRVFARVAIMPIILPIGAITSFLGGPLFLYLLFKGGKGK